MKAYKLWNNGDHVHLPTGWIHHILLFYEGTKRLKLFYVPQLQIVNMRRSTWDQLTKTELPLNNKAVKDIITNKVKLFDSINDKHKQMVQDDTKKCVHYNPGVVSSILTELG